jgi:hypothetical protein
MLSLCMFVCSSYNLSYFFFQSRYKSYGKNEFFADITILKLVFRLSIA